MAEEGISLYFRLKPGERANLEVVATAVLEWLEAARAAAQELEPGAQISVELVDADESSLRLNAVLGWVEGHLEKVDKGSSQYPRLRKLAVALAIFIPTTGAQTFSYYFPPKQEVYLSAEDRKLIEEHTELLRELVTNAQKNPEVKVRRQKFFKALERDPSITGTGITEGKTQPPLLIIPSDQFAENSGLWAMAEPEGDERTIYPIVEVTLVSPTLLPIPRSWRFKPDGLPEFNATMRDEHFLKALKSDDVKERLRTGIQMTLRLQVKEKRVADVWIVKPRRGRSVVEVIKPKVG